MAEAVTFPNSNVSIMFKPEGTGADEQSVVRRTGNYHPNVWEDDFIQSLSSPYGASWYRERVETLIKEIKVDAFNSLLLLLLEDPAAQITPSAYALVESFSIVDVVQRLGIDRYFETEIKTVLDYAYKHWNEGGISWGSENADFDLYTTALGFRILRLNGYHVSPDVFDNFQNENGQFVYPQPTKEGDSFRQLRNMLSLYRAAEISFPGEKKMKEAKSFASAYLQEALVQSQELSEETQLLAEVQYFVKYPWRCRVPRWEAWNSIQIFRNDINAWMSIDGVYKM